MMLLGIVIGLLAILSLVGIMAGARPRATHAVRLVVPVAIAALGILYFIESELLPASTVAGLLLVWMGASATLLLLPPQRARGAQVMITMLAAWAAHVSILLRGLAPVPGEAWRPYVPLLVASMVAGLPVMAVVAGVIRRPSAARTPPLMLVATCTWAAGAALMPAFVVAWFIFTLITGEG
jgi:hypothetical protein